MDDSQIKVYKVKSPLCLAVVKVLGLMEVCQIFMVSEDLDREWGSMEVVSPRF